ncbi:MAG: hypothetical protein WCD18_08030 [Thermosynechococcaceae cyanobacterium]
MATPIFNSEAQPQRSNNTLAAKARAKHLTVPGIRLALASMAQVTDAIDCLYLDKY